MSAALRGRSISSEAFISPVAGPAAKVVACST
jgi:hypothetical protein